MSNIRDAIADDYVDNHLSGERVAHIKYLDEQLERDTFCAGWQSALKNAPEVKTLLEKLERIGFRNEPDHWTSQDMMTGYLYCCEEVLDEANKAISEFKESLKKMNEATFATVVGVCSALFTPEYPIEDKANKAQACQVFREYCAPKADTEYPSVEYGYSKAKKGIK